MVTSVPLFLSALGGSLLALPATLATFLGAFFPTTRRDGVTNAKSTTNEPVTWVLDESDRGEDIDQFHTSRIFIPDVLVGWPWSRRQVNPNYDVVKKEADAWITSFHAFSPKVQDAYDRCDLDLLGCMTLPTARKEHVRSACDLMHLFFLFDEYSDRSTPHQVRVQKNAIMDAFRNPHAPRPREEWIGGEVARQFWERTLPSASADTQKRFLRYMDEYLESIIQESIDKRDNHILDIKNYINARRCTVGAKAAFCTIELGLDIPDEVMSHPAIQDVILAAVDLIAFYNDILSYNLERLRGDHLHNIITCVINEHHTNVNGAMLWVQDFLSKATERFHAAMATLPRWEEPLNSEVRAYCDGIGVWIRGSSDWSYESERYFGTKGQEIKENRWVSLLPIRHTTEIGPVDIDSSLL